MPNIHHNRRVLLANPPRGASFTPLSLSPQIWLDASQLGLSNGASVSSFTDLSGNGNHFVQGTGANQPVFETSGINSKGAVKADGVDDFMTLAAFGAHATWWSFIVFQPVVMAATKELWSLADFPAASPDYKLLETNGATTINVNQPFAAFPTGITLANNTTRGIGITGANTSMRLFSDNGTTSTLSPTGIGTNTGSLGNHGMRLFARGDPGLYFNARIGELLFGSGALTAGQELAVWTYLSTKWGTSIP